MIGVTTTTKTTAAGGQRLFHQSLRFGGGGGRHHHHGQQQDLKMMTASSASASAKTVRRVLSSSSPSLSSLSSPVSSVVSAASSWKEDDDVSYYRWPQRHHHHHHQQQYHQQNQTPTLRCFSSHSNLNDSRRRHESSGTNIINDTETTAESSSLVTEVSATSNNQPAAATSATTTPQKKTKAKAYLELAKAKLSALVVTTTAAGFVAAGGPLSEQALLATCCVGGTALCSSSAAAWNQIIEVDRDSQMKRTQQRPLVTGVLSLSEARTAATLWGIAGTSILALGTDPVTTALGFSNIVLYSGIYTYMKPRSVYNTQVGGIVGAIPPLMGWTAATGGSVLDLDAMVLASTLYLWQMPHFFALSYMHRVDYKRGGFAMLPVLESDGEKTSATILRNAVYLSTVPIVSTMTGVTSSMFALEGVVLNSYALYVAYKFRQERTNANARKVFLTSLWYLPCWLTLFLLHSKVWDEEKDRDVLRDAISDTIHKVRDQGKKLCIHEQVVAQTNHDDDACPVQLTKKGSDVVQEATTTAIQSSNIQKEI